MHATFDAAAVAAACGLVAAAATADAAATFRVMIGLLTDDDGSVPDRMVLGALAGFGDEPRHAAARLHHGEAAFTCAFGIEMFAREPPSIGVDKSRQTVDPGPDRPSPLRLSKAFQDLLCRRPATCETTTIARFDAATTSWVGVVAAAARSKRGHHLVFRARDQPGECTMIAFAGQVVAHGASVVHLRRADHLLATILHLELHAAATPSVVLGDGPFLVMERQTVVVGEFSSEGPPDDADSLILTDGGRKALPWLRELRNTYIWRVPAIGTLPPELTGIIGGCIKPIGYDRSWSASVLEALVAGVGPSGKRALLSFVDDPRDAVAMACMATVVADALAMPVDEACRFVAASFGTIAPAPEPPSTYDPGLFACEPDAMLLLDKGSELASGRVLVYGPPGGGKSTYALVLAQRISAARGNLGAVVAVEPGAHLAKAWGATERLLSALWQRAESEGATLLADEFDSMGAVREADAPASGNAYLIRTLTNEWLRRLDAHPDVPLVATVNDLTTVDPAIRRRFQWVVEVRDELDLERERLAWTVIFKMPCPDDWRPTRASVADYATAAGRCRALGQTQAAAYAKALLAVRDARRAGVADLRGVGGGRPLH